jgi:hypothetical protein
MGKFGSGSASTRGGERLIGVVPRKAKRPTPKKHHCSCAKGHLP